MVLVGAAVAVAVGEVVGAAVVGAAVVDGSVVGGVVGAVDVGGALVGVAVGEVGGEVGSPPCSTSTWFPGAKLTWLVHWPPGAAAVAFAVIVELPPAGMLPELWLSVIHEFCGVALQAIGLVPALRNRIETLLGSAERWLTLTKKAAAGSLFGGEPGWAGLVVITEPVRVGVGWAAVWMGTDGPALGDMITDSPPAPVPVVTRGSAGEPPRACAEWLDEVSPSTTAEAAATVPTAPKATAEITACRTGLDLCRARARARARPTDEDGEVGREPG